LLSVSRISKRYPHPYDVDRVTCMRLGVSEDFQ
jgi:hypothetical protein